MFWLLLNQSKNVLDHSPEAFRFYFLCVRFHLDLAQAQSWSWSEVTSTNVEHVFESKNLTKKIVHVRHVCGVCEVGTTTQTPRSPEPRGGQNVSDIYFASPSTFSVGKSEHLVCYDFGAHCRCWTFRRNRSSHFLAGEPKILKTAQDLRNRKQAQIFGLELLHPQLNRHETKKQSSKHSARWICACSTHFRSVLVYKPDGVVETVL